MTRRGILTSDLPEHPDGTKYTFNCCALPMVRETRVERGEKEYWCESCGYDWTGAMDK